MVYAKHIYFANDAAAHLYYTILHFASVIFSKCLLTKFLLILKNKALQYSTCTQTNSNY